MKRIVLSLLALGLLLGLSGCLFRGGDTRSAVLTEKASRLYTDEEIRAAAETAEAYFRKNFPGCTMTEISYIGDEANESYQDFADRAGAEQVIVLVSTFTTDGHQEALNPNDTYPGWKWILVRDRGGAWRHEDHGY